MPRELLWAAGSLRGLEVRVKRLARPTLELQELTR